jgi:CheY-like chemotaxis protein
MRALEGVRVLLVDDEADSLEVTRVMLESEGAVVASATGADEALAVVRADPPDVVLCDIAMPERDGLWLVRKVRALPGGRGIPMAALTAHASAATRDQVLRAGFRLHLTKPADPQTLTKAVKRLLQGGKTG